MSEWNQRPLVEKMNWFFEKLLGSTVQHSGLNWNKVLFLVVVVVVDAFKQEWLQLSWRTNQTSPAMFPEILRVCGGAALPLIQSPELRQQDATLDNNCAVWGPRPFLSPPQPPLFKMVSSLRVWRGKVCM